MVREHMCLTLLSLPLKWREQGQKWAGGWRPPAWLMQSVLGVRCLQKNGEVGFCDELVT